MADFIQLQKIVKEIKDHPHVRDVTIVSRSGMHVAGDIPAAAHMETYVAMSAILLGAAESATGELKDRLGHIIVQLQNGKMVVAPAGKKALLVLSCDMQANPADLAETAKNFAEQIENAI